MSKNKILRYEVGQINFRPTIVIVEKIDEVESIRPLKLQEFDAIVNHLNKTYVENELLHKK